jgi:hypothetical protein
LWIKWGKGLYLFNFFFFGRIVTALRKASSLASNQLQRLNRMLEGFVQRVTLVVTLIGNSLLR